MRAALLAAVLLGACAPRPSRSFRVGALLPLGPRAAASAARLGLELTDAPPAGAAVESAAAADGTVAPAARLRFLWSRAAAEGRSGVYFVLPAAPAGRELTDFPEEWQALARAAREAALLRPIVEGGFPEAIAAPEGVSAGAWRYAGRRYAVYVNGGAAPALLPEAALAGRPLFAARADAREILPACPGGSCLPPGGVLWLEGRLFAADAR